MRPLSIIGFGVVLGSWLGSVLKSAAMALLLFCCLTGVTLPFKHQGLNWVWDGPCFLPWPFHCTALSCRCWPRSPSTFWPLLAVGWKFALNPVFRWTFVTQVLATLPFNILAAVAYSLVVYGMTGLRCACTALSVSVQRAVLHAVQCTVSYGIASALAC